MANVRMFIIIAVAATLAACAGREPEVDYDPSANFQRYQTYTWAPASQVPGSGDPRVSPLTAKKIQQAINWELQAKGFRPADAADFRVAYSAAINEYEEPRSYGGWGWGGGPGFGVGGSGVGVFVPLGGRNAIEYRQAVIAIDIFDAATDEPVWHGHTSARLNTDTIPPAVIDDSVKEILGAFPPP